MEYAVYESPAVSAPVDERTSYLRKVGVWTLMGLGTSTVTALGSAAFFAFVGSALLSSQLVTMGVILGCWFGAHYGCGALVNGNGSASTKAMGLLAGSALQGVALGVLLLMAVAVSAEALGNPLALLFQAIALVGVTAIGMCGYLLTGPRNLSPVRAILGVMTIPMLIAMAVSFVFPVNGMLGILMSVGFVAFSSLALLYQLNLVIHQLSTKQHIEGAFMVTMGLLVLFWNVLVLLMRLNSRD